MFDKFTLILISSHLIWQWANDIIIITNKFKILIYFDDSQKKFSVSIYVFNELITDHVIFDDQLKYNWIIILSLYLILAQWHELSAQSDWHKKIQKLCYQKIEKKYLVLDFTWFKFLKNLFCIIILNEAHQLWNLFFFQVIIIFWLNTEFNFLFTVIFF